MGRSSRCGCAGVGVTYGFQRITFWRGDPDKAFARGDMEIYAVDFERCTTAAELLGALLRLRRQPWATPDVLADFLRCVDAVCLERFDRDTLTTFCSGRDVDWQAPRDAPDSAAERGDAPRDAATPPPFRLVNVGTIVGSRSGAAGAA